MLKVDNQVFKIDDPRVSALSKASLPVQQFIYTIKPGDWFIFLGDTVYALTEIQYYAVQSLNLKSELTQDQFQGLLQNIPEELLQEDKNQLYRIKKLKRGCSTCQYKSFKNKVLKIISKYDNIVRSLNIADVPFNITEYPHVKAPIQEKVSKLLPIFFYKTEYERTSCLDCVQKHVSMAFVKGNQAVQGYPTHLKLALANLQEAYEECPKDCDVLRDLILFCIGKSKKDNKIFVPLENFLYLIELSRAQTHAVEALQRNQTDETFDLELTKQMKRALFDLPVVKKAQLMKNIQQLIHIEYSQDISNMEALYQGYLGTIANDLVPFCPDVSNVLRNRRLVFRASPQLVRNTEYDCKDLKYALLQCPKDQEKN